MNKRGASEQSQAVQLTKAELDLINNALNEILHGPGAIGDAEFHTRVGAARVEAESLLRRVGDLIKRA